MDNYYQMGDSIKTYRILKLLGEGRYGIAYLAENEEGHLCIVKQLKNDMLTSTKSKLFYEQAILRSLDSPFFPKFIGTFKDKTRQGYLLEYKEGKVFNDLLDIDHVAFTRKDIYKIANQLLDIIKVLYAHRIVHRDIRLPNVIVDHYGNLSLIDFGLARYINATRYTKEIDYWYLGDFLIHLYYTSYYINHYTKEKPWYEELKLTPLEKRFLKKLMGIYKPYSSISEIRHDLNKLQQSM